MGARRFALLSTIGIVAFALGCDVLTDGTLSDAGDTGFAGDTSGGGGSGGGGSGWSEDVSGVVPDGAVALEVFRDFRRVEDFGI